MLVINGVPLENSSVENIKEGSGKEVEENPWSPTLYGSADKNVLSLAHLWLVISVLLHLAQLDNVYPDLKKSFGIHHWVWKAGLPGFLLHLHSLLLVAHQSESVRRKLMADHPLLWQSC